MNIVFLSFSAVSLHIGDFYRSILSNVTIDEYDFHSYDRNWQFIFASFINNIRWFWQILLIACAIATLMCHFRLIRFKYAHIWWAHIQPTIHSKHPRHASEPSTHCICIEEKMPLACSLRPLPHQNEWIQKNYNFVTDTFTTFSWSHLCDHQHEDCDFSHGQIQRYCSAAASENARDIYISPHWISNGLLVKRLPSKFSTRRKWY